jgi:hypothetical protein
MRLTINKSIYKSIGILTFILLLIFKGILPQAVYALLQNEETPNQAKDTYCSFYPLNLVCGSQGKSSVLYNYKFHEIVHYRRSGYPDKFITLHYRSWRPAPGAIRSLGNKYPGIHFGGGYPPSGDYVTWISLNDGDGNNQTRGVVYEYSTGDTMTWDDYANYSNNNIEGGWISDLVAQGGIKN